MKCTDCSQLVRPVVAVDIDGTLGDYHRHFARFCERYYDNNILDKKPWDGTGEFEDWLGLTKVQYREAKLAYRQGGTKRWMPIYPDADYLVNSLRSIGAEVWIATTRPWQRLDNIDPDTREWLRRNRIDFDGLLYGDNKYEQLCETVEQDRILAVVEDLPEQFDIAQKMNLPAIHRWNFHNAHERRDPGSSKLIDIARMVAERIEAWRIQNDNR